VCGLCLGWFGGREGVVVGEELIYLWRVLEIIYSLSVF
jgi:hypothetical protein